MTQLNESKVRGLKWILAKLNGCCKGVTNDQAQSKEEWAEK